MRVLVVNAGSSSVKLRLLEGDELVRLADLPATADGFDRAGFAAAIDGWPTPDAVGHRIVHGGTAFSGPVRIDPDVRRRLQELTDLAPLHQPKSLAALDIVTAELPGPAAVGCFDTAFHATIPEEASTYAIPLEWRERWAIRRYGFHGLSHAYASRRACELAGRPLGELRIVTCHLGAGASLAAVVDGRSVDTTMGFTPLEGLVMATRSGTVDPGLVLWLESHEHLSPHEISKVLETRSGLLGLTGTADMREVEAAAGGGDARARLGFGVYIHRLAGEIASMAAAAGGLDVVVFTGGVGEHSPGVRRAVTRRLGFLGVTVDDDRNARALADADISAAGSPVGTFVVTAREDLQIAGEVRTLFDELGDGDRPQAP